MTDLLIDLGNSRLKWAQSALGLWSHSATTHRGRDFIKVLDEAWAEMAPPARVIYVSVAADDRSAALESWIDKRWGARSYRLRSQREQSGVINTYRDPFALGADRWAALVGARALTARACAVVDCGTALTIDALSSDGVFTGGVIITGLYLLRQSLGAGTAGIGSLEGDDSNCLAHTTADGVAAGALFGLAGAIERVLSEQERALDTQLEIFMTGGDAPLLMSRLTRPSLQVSDLVLKGLARVAQEMT